MDQLEVTSESTEVAAARPPFVAAGKTGFFEQPDGTVQVLRNDQPACVVPKADIMEYAARHVE